MGYKLKDITIDNFKYIGLGKGKKIIFDDYDMIVLDGPNGYGKSTLFDAIELLITGTIKHFNENLPNRGKESLSILANEQTHNVLINATFNNGEGDLYINRVFDCDNEFNSKITIGAGNNLREISQNQLYEELGINKNFFDIGIYISQSESLEFLQKKYKERKDQLTGILDSSEIISKIEKIKVFKKLLEEKCDSNLASLEKQKNDNNEKMENILKTISEINAGSEAVKYQKLFEKEYEFDKEKLDTTVDYRIQTYTLGELESFLTDYNDYIVTVNNKKIDDVITKNKNEYVALYYKFEIDDINNQKDLIYKLQKTKEYLSQLELGNYIYEEAILTFIGLDEKDSLRVKELLNEKQNAQNQLDTNQKSLKELIEKRTLLNNSYKSTISIGAWDKEKCPFCGFVSENIEDLFNYTSQILNSNTDYSYKQLDLINTSIKMLFDEKIIPLIKSVLLKEQKLLMRYNALNFYTTINPEGLNSMLEDLDVSDFRNKLDIIDFDIFEKEYLLVLNKLELIKKPTEKSIPMQRIENYKMLHEKYYNNLEPIHKLIEFQNKKFYIAFQYSNKYVDDLNKYKELNQSIIEKYTKLDENIKSLKKNISDLSLKYEEAYKQYQTDMANKIRIPLFMFSGKIIQNYPMGLGILIDVKDNQIVFRASGKDCDIFNILSTGQLNGVILSILLAVKSVFANESGLNMLLIDDPLQSIDDISAYSFADVLSEQFEDTQIIISTHEEDKANLFRFKCSQLGIKTHTYNMQKLYLSD